MTTAVAPALLLSSTRVYCRPSLATTRDAEREIIKAPEGAFFIAARQSPPPPSPPLLLHEALPQSFP